MSFLGEANWAPSLHTHSSSERVTLEPPAAYREVSVVVSVRFELGW